MSRSRGAETNCKSPKMPTEPLPKSRTLLSSHLVRRQTPEEARMTEQKERPTIEFSYFNSGPPESVSSVADRFSRRYFVDLDVYLQGLTDYLIGASIFIFGSYSYTSV